MTTADNKMFAVGIMTEKLIGENGNISRFLMDLNSDGLEKWEG